MRGSRLGWAEAAVLASILVSSAALGSEALRQQALALVNEARGGEGLRPLTLDDSLSEAAQKHAEDMLRRTYYAHESPEGETVMDRYRRAGGQAGRAVAENISRIEGPVPQPGPAIIERLHRGWMNSPEHRDNILGNFTRFGFGLAHSEGRLYAVQTFAGPGSSPGGGNARRIAPAEQTGLAVEILNEARDNAGAPPLEPAPEVSQALRAALPEPPDEMAPDDLLRAARRQHPGAAGIVAGRCGGCGASPTDADIRFFLEEWLQNDRYRAMLLSPQYGELGFALAADGKGRKQAVAVLARR